MRGVSAGMNKQRRFPRKRNGHRRRQVVARLRARHDPCAICGQPIDYDLPAGHPMSFECDEIIPVSRGGSEYDLNNVQAAHRICNQKRGNRLMEELLDPEHPVIIANDATLPLSRDW